MQQAAATKWNAMADRPPLSTAEQSEIPLVL